MTEEKTPLLNLPTTTPSALANLATGLNTIAGGGSNGDPALNFGAFQAAPNVEATNSAKVKLPDFVEEHTDLWFWQVEAAFDAAGRKGRKADKKKYNTIIGQLPTRVMYKLADLRTHVPPAGQMYKTRKARIVNEFADSTQTKITKLLGNMALGDRKPFREAGSATIVGGNAFKGGQYTSG